MPIRAIIQSILLGGSVSLFAPGLLLFADDLSGQNLAEDVKVLIQELDANRLSVRRNAEEQLLKLGPAVLPYFPPPEFIARPGVRQILSRLRVQLEEQQARLSVKGTQVNLTGRYRLIELIKRIEKQTGNRLHAGQLPLEMLNREVDVTFQQTGFWRALDDLAAKYQFDYRFPPGSAALQLVARDEQASAQPVGVSYSGPFRIAVESLRRRPEFGDVRLTMELEVEPRLRPLFLSYAASNWSVMTAEGHQLLPRNPEAQWELPLAGASRATQVRMDFTGADQSLTEMSLSAKLSMTIAAGEEPIRFSELLQAQGTARRRGGVTVTLKFVKAAQPEPKKHDLNIQAAVAYDANGPAFESHRTWIYHNRVYLENGEGERINFPGGQRTSFSRTGGVLIDYPFRDLSGDLKKYQFVYVAPTLILDDVPVTIDFDALPVQN